MAHIHGVYDTDTHFILNAVTKELTVAEDFQKVKVIQYDHNSERFTFELPRMIEGHDMSLCNKATVHYLNVDSQTKLESKDIYTIEDLQISPENEDVVICSWLVSHTATKYVGSLYFVLRLECITNDTIDYALNTLVYEGIYVGKGIYNSNAIVSDNLDILEQWKKEILEEISSTSGGGVSSWNDLTDKPFGESETGGDTLTWDGNITTLEGVFLGLSTAYYMSDVIPTTNDVSNGGTIEIEGSTLELEFQDMSGLLLGVDTDGVHACAIVPTDNFELSGIVFPKAGTYLCGFPEDGVHYDDLTINGYKGFPMVKPIDTKYLPLDIFVVNVSENGVTKDKAHAEILEAFSNFKTVILVYVGMTFGLTMIDEEGNLIFSKLIVVNGILTNTGFTIKTDETVTMIEDVYTLTPMG